jgi:uncharacterized protein YecT (DUF1311 family)
MFILASTKSKLAGALILFAAAGTAGAQEPSCDDPQTQSEMTRCASSDYERADKELNEVWADAINDASLNDLGLDDDRLGYEEQLRKAQSAWIAFRDASCQYEGYQARGGTMEPMLVNMCLARMTKERTKQLRELMQEMGTQ